ncbi:hypothetical protein HAX54_005438 [Datura stramonium]|uniref:Acylamino-acid-releasing enzyme N-terminal domain-containing protein n=1 Tax=Datura stramonium TaxID=4076 RepID=A0ABS8T9Y7_DATST|nr:hypothetical protein [Datura stramonium]
MFSISQPNLLASKNRRYILSSYISKGSTNGVSFQWAAFPIEMPSGFIMSMVPSPSGSKLLVVRNSEKESPTKFEIWVPSQVEKEFHVSPSVHGSVYSDGWFEGILWNDDETFVAYVAEEPAPSKPMFTSSGYKKGNSSDKECGSWKGQGDWEEDWGETYPGKREASIFVINVNSGEVHPVEGTRNLSVGQVVWALACKGLQQYLVFVGWSSDTRKLGIKYCYNRPCALYAVRAPLSKSEDHQSGPDGKALVFLSAKSSVDSWVHSATQSLHRIDWSIDGKPSPDADILDVSVAVPLIFQKSSMAALLESRSAEALASWQDISSPIYRCSEKVTSLLSSRRTSIIKIPVKDISENLTAVLLLLLQAPDKFAAAATRNPVCSLPLMVGTSDIPELVLCRDV